MRVEREGGRWIAVEFERFAGAGDALPEAVGIAEDAGSLGDDRVAIIHGVWEVFRRDLAVQPAGVVDLVDCAGWRVCTFREGVTSWLYLPNLLDPFPEGYADKREATGSGGLSLCDPPGTRTPNPLIKSQLLCH